MAVPAEAGARRDAILIDDAQHAPAHFGRIVVIGKGEAVPRLQPAVIGITALFGRTQDNHGNSL